MMKWKIIIDASYSDEADVDLHNITTPMTEYIEV